MTFRAHLSSTADSIVGSAEPRPDPRHFLSKSACMALGHRILEMARGGHTNVNIVSRWERDIRWARNRIALAADRGINQVSIGRADRGASTTVDTNQTDDISLRAALDAAERLLRLQGTVPQGIGQGAVSHVYPDTHVWSESTFDQATDARTAVARRACQIAESAGMLSAGFVQLRAVGRALLGTEGYPDLYTPQTIAQCSVTVRDAKGSGSGWAGASSYDWARCNVDEIAEIALRKCLQSRNPSVVEPGRWTVILEPQAVYELMSYLFCPALGADHDQLRRDMQEGTPRDEQVGAFAKEQRIMTYDGLEIHLGVSRLGERIFDPRITVTQDPLDLDLGTIPYQDPDNPYRATTWIENGVLVKLYTDRWWALNYKNENEGYPTNSTFKVSGGTTTMDEMIRGTPRGLLVTRFGNTRLVNAKNVLISGFTRDGLWLIENGVVSRPVKNFRFTESPFFAFNQVDQLGVPVPIFSPGLPAIVPPMKIHDFNFSSLTDAV